MKGSRNALSSLKLIDVQVALWVEVQHKQMLEIHFDISAIFKNMKFYLFLYFQLICIALMKICLTDRNIGSY